MDFKGHVALATRPASSADRARRSLALRRWCWRPAPTSSTDDGPGAAHHRLPPLRPARGADHRQRFALGRRTRQPFTPLAVWLIEHGIRSAIRGPTIRRPRARTSASTAPSRPRCCPVRPSPISPLPSAPSTAGATSTTRKRPHEALELAVPASRYQPSPRNYAETIAPFEYAPGDIVRRVQQGGHVSFLGRTVKVPKAFRGKAVAFRSTTHDGVFDVVFLTQRIAIIDIRPSTSKVSTMSPNARPPCPRSEQWERVDAMRSIADG